MVQTWGYLSAVFRNGQLWMVIRTPSGVSSFSASVPARPIHSTTRSSFWSNVRPFIWASMPPAYRSATFSKTASTSSGPPSSVTSVRIIVASWPYRFGKAASALSVRENISEGLPLLLFAGSLWTRPSRSRLVRCWRTALGVMPSCPEIVSALAACLRRRSSRTSILVDRPAIRECMSGGPGRELSTATDRVLTTFFKDVLDKISKAYRLHSVRQEVQEGEAMIQEACVAIEDIVERERRAREVKYSRRNRIRYIDRLLNELEMLNLAERTEVPERLGIELDRLMAESTVVELVQQPRPDSVTEAMDVLYEIQDSLMLNEADEE